MTDFILNRYSVGVGQFSGVMIFAKSIAQARARAFRGYQGYDDRITFKEFLKMRPSIAKVDMLENFGKKILVNPYDGEFEEVYFMGKNGNTVSYVYPGKDTIVSCHELDADISTLNLGQQ